MKNKEKHHTVGTFPKSNRKIVERGKIGTLYTQIYDLSLFWLVTSTSIKSCGVKYSLDMPNWLIKMYTLQIKHKYKFIDFNISSSSDVHDQRGTISDL